MRPSRRSAGARRERGGGLCAAVRGHPVLLPRGDCAIGAPMNADCATPMRRAAPQDVPRIARLFAGIFARDPVFNWLVRDGDARASALQRFFGWILESRTIPHGETWITADGLAAAAWIPPHAQETPPRLADDLRMLPVILKLTGLPRLARGAAMAAAMEEAHPRCRISILPSSAWRRACREAAWARRS